MQWPWELFWKLVPVVVFVAFGIALLVRHRRTRKVLRDLERIPGKYARRLQQRYRSWPHVQDFCDAHGLVLTMYGLHGDVWYTIALDAKATPTIEVPTPEIEKIFIELLEFFRTHPHLKYRNSNVTAGELDCSSLVMTVLRDGGNLQSVLRLREGPADGLTIRASHEEFVGMLVTAYRQYTTPTERPVRE